MDGWQTGRRAPAVIVAGGLPIRCRLHAASAGRWSSLRIASRTLSSLPGSRHSSTCTWAWVGAGCGWLRAVALLPCPPLRCFAPRPGLLPPLACRLHIGRIAPMLPPNLAPTHLLENLLLQAGAGMSPFGSWCSSPPCCCPDFCRWPSSTSSAHACCARCPMGCR